MARYDLGLVKGPKGDKGDQGATGPVGPQGIQGPPAKVCGKEPDTQGNIVLGVADVDGLSAELAGKSGTAHTHTLSEVGGSNRNLLDNWYFGAPINQRGQESYTAGGYTIDRWQAVAATVAVSDDHIRVVTGSGTFKRFRQPVEGKYAAGTVVTVSMLAKVNSVSGGAFLRASIGDSDANVRAQLSATQGVELFTATGSLSAAAENNLMFELWASNADTNGYDVEIIAAKLELGPVQTLAHQENGAWVLNDPPPNPALELAKCQRYYYAINGLSVGYPYAALLTAKSETEAFGVVEVPANMRVRPVLVYSGAWQLFETATLTKRVITDLKVDTANANGCTSKIVVLATSTGLTLGQVYWLCGNGITNGIPRLAFDANL